MRLLAGVGGRYNIGYIMENVVAECLMKCGKSIYYYIKRSGKDMMELDFVISMNGRVGVIEVKSGKDRTAPSIRKSSQYFDIGRRIMFENGDIQVDPDGIEHYPVRGGVPGQHAGPERGADRVPSRRPATPLSGMPTVFSNSDRTRRFGQVMFNQRHQVPNP